MFKVEFSRTFVKGIKKIPKEVQSEVLNKWVPRLQNDPCIGRRFAGKKLKKFLKLAFRFKKNDYRIVYQVKKKEILIVFLAVGSRKNFYKKLKL